MRNFPVLVPEETPPTTHRKFADFPRNKVAAIMPKQKTHKGMSKRFKVTASGKIKHRKAFRGHKLSHKSGKRKRGLRQDGVVIGQDAKNIREALLPGV
jgi:large subunit ribosomal protein L35